jgi:hypothetical protein
VGKTEDGWVSEDWWKKHGRPRDPAVFVRITEERIKKAQKSKMCSCGVEGCRKRKGHDRPVIEVEEVKLHFGTIPMQEVVPPIRCYGCQTCSFRCDHWISPPHERWERAVAYAARDALLALWLNDRMEQEMSKGVPFPWGS